MRIITVGTSKICRDMIKAMKLAGFTVHACVSRNINRARDFAISNGVKFYLDDYDKALTSKNFEAVYIALPNALHFEYAKKALLANKHVILEKPFCTNYRDSEELFNIAKARGLFIFENMKVVHNSALDHLRKAIVEIAPVRNIQANMYELASSYDEFKKGNLPNVFNPKLGGGALLDLNVYNVMFMIDLFGLPDSLSYHPHIDSNVDVSGCAIFHYDDFDAVLNAGYNADSKSYILLSGENGYITINSRITRLREFDLYRNGALIKHYKYNVEDFLVSNAKDFIKIINETNYDLYNKYVSYTLMEIKTLELLAQSGNLNFD